MPRPLRVEGRVLSSSIRRSREMWIHFVFTIQCSGKGCICRGVSDSVAMRGCYYWVKSRFCNWWEFLMASKHAGLEIVLWLNELVRYGIAAERRGYTCQSSHSIASMFQIFSPCAPSGYLFFASFHVGQEKRIVMQLFAFALSSFFMLVAKSQPAFPPGIGDVMRQLAASVCVHFWIQWSRHFLQRHE